MSHVSGAEFKVLMCIIDRTILWGKDAERITQKHIVEGIPGTCGGTGVSRRGVNNSIKRLQEIGVISVIERTSGNTYSVNTSWRKVMLKVPKNKKERPTGLKVPSSRGSQCTQDVQPVHTGGAVSAQHKKGTYKEENFLTSRPLPVSVAEVVEDAQERNRSRRKSKIASTKKKGVDATVADLELVWRTALEQNELFSACSYSPWTTKEKGMMKNFMKSLTLKGGSLADYLEWVVDTWHTIAAARFAQVVRSSLIGERRALLAAGLIRDCEISSRAGLRCCQ